MASAVSGIGIRTVCGNIARMELDNIDKFGTYTRLFFEDRSYTNQEELDYAAKLARVLRDHDVQRGDRVMVMLPNSPELTASFQAVWTAGAIIAPIMPNWTAKEICAVLQNAEPACVLTCPPLAPLLEGSLAGVRSKARLLVFGESEGPGSENIVPEVEAADAMESPDNCSGSDLALLLYTSGTTAAPKGAAITHSNLFSAVDSAYRKNGDLPRSPMVHVLPLTHSFGLLMLKLANLWGFTDILVRSFDPVKVFQAIERHQAQYMPVVPTMLIYLLNHPERSRYNLTSLRRITSGGMALPEAVRVAFEEACNCRVEQGYGLSETVALTSGYDEEEPYRVGSVGRPAPGVEVRIVDAAERSLPPGSIGDIYVYGHNVMHGYWRDREATDAAFAGNWLRTGDVGYLNDDGYLYITDRKKDLIIKGGENISPREIEEVLHLHPAVAAAAVVGVPDPVFGENICAVLQLKPDRHATEPEIREHISHHVTKFKIPSMVLFWEDLPRSFTGKISKRDVRERLKSVSVGARET